VQEFLLEVELPLGVELPGGGSISQEVKPEDEMATDSQNGDIIVLSSLRHKTGEGLGNRV
jgi:hypothetical protein